MPARASLAPGTGPPSRSVLSTGQTRTERLLTRGCSRGIRTRAPCGPEASVFVRPPGRPPQAPQMGAGTQGPGPPGPGAARPKSHRTGPRPPIVLGEGSRLPPAPGLLPRLSRPRDGGREASAPCVCLCRCVATTRSPEPSLGQTRRRRPVSGPAHGFRGRRRRCGTPRCCRITAIGARAPLRRPGGQGSAEWAWAVGPSPQTREGSQPVSYPCPPGFVPVTRPASGRWQ